MTRSSLLVRFLLVMLVCMSMPMATPSQARDLLRTGGPDAFGYIFTDSTEPDGPTYQWIEIVGNGGTRLDLGDDNLSNIVSPFAIQYYDLATTDVRISNNGALFLGSTSASLSFTNQPMAGSAPNYLVAPHWDDVRSPADPAGVYWAVVGTAPNRQFVVQWDDVRVYNDSGATDLLTWQVVFTEGSPNILFQYQDVTSSSPGTAQGASATVGIRGANAAQSLQYSYVEAALSDNLAIQFNAPAPGVTLNPATATQSGVPGTDVVYQLQVSNFTGVSDTLSLTYEGGSWPISGLSNVGPLDNAGQATVPVTVTIPMSATIGDTQVHTVTLSSSDQTYTDTAVLTTKAEYAFACTDVPASIPTFSSTGISRQLNVNGVPLVTGIQVVLDITTTAPQQLIVDLQSPDGQTVVLHNQTTNSVQGTYTTTLTVDGPGSLEDFIGGAANGTWTLRARNPSGFTAATLESCQIIFAPVPDGLYLTPIQDSLQVTPASSTPYTMTLVNTTAQTQVVDFDYQSAIHMIDGPLNAVVGPDESATISLVINANPTAAPLQNDLITVTASTNALSATSTLNVMVVDTWELRASMNVTRSGPAAASDDAFIYVFGGRNAPSGSPLASMEVYNPVTNTWQAGPAMPGAKERASAVELNGIVYVVGGENPSYLTSNYAYTPGVDPVNGTWATKQPMQVGVSSMVAVADPQTDQVYVFGGRTGGINTTDAVQVFTPDAGVGQWTRGVTMPLSLGRSVGTRLDRKVYITGGVVQSTANTKLLIYDLDAQTWSFGPDLPQHRNFSSMAAIGDNVCVAGGAVSFSPAATSWCFNTVSESWFQIASLNVARQYLDVVAGPDGIYAIGGETSNAATSQGTCTSNGGSVYCATVERYGAAPANLGASTKTVSPSTVQAGSLVTYTLTLSNTGDMSVTASLTDTLDPALTVVELGAPLQGSDVLTAMVNVPAASSVVLTFTAQVSGQFSGTLMNSFDLSGDGNVYTIIGEPLMVTSAPTEPAASFVSSSPDTLGETTSFTNTSTGDITSFMWDFGDGSTSTLENPTHTYTATGMYTVTLMVSGSEGSDTFTSTVEIVAAGVAPVASFTSSSPDTLGQTTSFTNTSTGDITSFMWDFGDGSTSTLENPTHTYTATGTYTVTLMVSGSEGSDTFTDTVEIIAAPTVVINAMPNPALVGQTVEFSSTATGSGLSYLWDFGNGQTSTEMNPSFIYGQVGSYTVTLTVTDENGVEATATITVEVRASIFLPIVRK